MVNGWLDFFFTYQKYTYIVWYKCYVRIQLRFKVDNLGGGDHIYIYIYVDIIDIYIYIPIYIISMYTPILYQSMNLP